MDGRFKKQELRQPGGDNGGIAFQAYPLLTPHFDLVLSFDPLIVPTVQQVFPVWRSLPIPVADRVYTDEVIPPDGRTGKHRHMAEEFMFIVEGRGYSLHWDVELEMGDSYGWKVSTKPQRYDWEAGDWVYVPVNTVHQHFNLESGQDARFISASSRIYKLLGWHDLEQMENAPEWNEV